MPHPEDAMSRTLAGLLVAAAVVTGCRSAAPPPAIPADQLETAVAALAGPPSTDAATLYRLRVPSTSGLRASIATSSDGGRMSISDSFGRALLVAAWTSDGAGELYDLDAGCRVPGADLAAMIGAGGLPIEQAVWLLSGRLPAAPGDRIEIGDGGLEITGEDWSAHVVVARDPWRVLEVRSDTRGATAWRIELADHTRSLPKSVFVERADGEWARLELVRRETTPGAELPDLPDLPVCGHGGGR